MFFFARILHDLQKKSKNFFVFWLFFFWVDRKKKKISSETNKKKVSNKNRKMKSSSKWSQMAEATKRAKEARKNGGVVHPQAAPQQPRENNNHNNDDVKLASLMSPSSRFRKTTAAPPPVVPVALSDFTWADVYYLPKRGGGANSKGMPTLIGLRNPTQGPMCIELKGGGTIPPTIGLSLNDYGKTRLTFTLDKPEERHALDRMHTDMVASTMTHAKDWYPNDEILDYGMSVGRVLSEVKAKKDGSGEYPQLASANILEKDLIAADLQHEPELVVMGDGGKRAVFNLLEVLGQRWDYMVLELQWLVIGRDRDTNQPLVTLSRRVRRLYIQVDENVPHLVFPQDRESHDASECKRKHTIPHDLTTFSLKENAIIGELKTKAQACSARLESKGGGDVILVLKGGGTLPFFVIDTNQQGNLVFSFSIDSAEDERCLDAIADELRNHAVTNRGVYFPKSPLPDEVLRYTVKRLLGKKSDKPEYADFTRNMSCIFEPDKVGTTVRIVDGMGENISPSKETLVGKKWKEAWIVLRSIYKQTKGDLFEVGFSKRLVYIQLACDMSDYSLVAAPPAPAVVLPTEVKPEPDAKRARTS